MKILLQDGMSELYAGREEWWTSDPMEALGFENIPEAVDYIFAHNLENVRVLVKPGEAEEETLIPEIELDVRAKGP